MIGLDQLEEYIKNNPDNLDRDTLLMYTESIRRHVTFRDNVLRLIRESVEQLRMDLKYLSFDLEATRRERDEALRKLNND